MIEIVPARGKAKLDTCRKLLRTYAAIRGHDDALGNFEEELQTLPDKYQAILLARSGSSYVGCVAIRQIEDGACEMKRLFVLPSFRGKGAGRKLAAAIIEEASQLGFQWMKLDTHPSMKQAQDLYESLGFRPISRYNDNPTPGIRFYEKELKKPRTKNVLGL